MRFINHARSLVALFVFFALLPGTPLHSAAPRTKTELSDQGNFYWADGRIMPLLQRTNQLAVSIDSPAVLTELTAKSGVLAGFREVRTLSATIRVLETTQAVPVNVETVARQLEMQRQATKKATGVRWVAPVFQSKEYGVAVVIADEVIIRLLPGVDAAAFFAGDSRFAGYRPLLGTDDQFVVRSATGAGLPTLLLANQLQSGGRVRWATPNFYQDVRKTAVTNDPLLGNQWHLNNTGQSGGSADADVDGAEAWDVVPGGSATIVVAVIDDGVQLDHPDLVDNIFVNSGEVGGNGIDDDGNGYIDDVSGWDFVNDDTNAAHDSDEATDGHGTAVAGVIAARGNNALGVSGIAYQSRILPVRVFDGNAVGTDADFSEAIYYAAGRRANGSCCWRAADILNNSWGGGAPNTATTEAVTFAATSGRSSLGATTFFASGNDSASSVSYPAILAGSIPGVIAVGASTDGDTRAGYSNIGPELDFVAPSSGGSFGIVSTDRTGADGYNDAAGAAGDYTSTAASAFGGTSSATPLAAGIAALILARDSSLTPAQLRGLMRNTTELIGPLDYGKSGFNVEYGYGRLNANTAVRGIGVAEIQVFHQDADIPDGGTLNVTAIIGIPITQTLRIRNQGTQDLTLGAFTFGDGPVSVLMPPADTTLSVGESTTLVLQIAPSAASATQSLRLANNDTDEGPFDLTFAITGQAPSMIGRVYHDWNADGAHDANDPPLAGELVFLDINNDGSFYTSASASGLPQPIVDNGQITSSLAVSGISGTVTDINVTLTISHTFDSDLDVFLISPTGTRVELFSSVGSDGQGFNGTILDDQATIPITSGQAPFVGSYRPEGPLAVLNGEMANGTWTLEVNDVAAGDAGMLEAWSLTLADEPYMLTNSDGLYAFLDLPAGNYTVHQPLSAGWNATGPASGTYTVMLTAGTSVTGLDFGRNRPNAIYGQTFSDLDGDSVHDADEPAVSGWNVFLDTNANGVPDSGEPSTTSDSLGNYFFSGLTPGSYIVRQVDQAGWKTTLPSGGSYAVTLAAGATAVDKNFGNHLLIQYQVALPLVASPGG